MIDPAIALELQRAFAASRAWDEAARTILRNDGEFEAAMARFWKLNSQEGPATAQQAAGGDK